MKTLLISSIAIALSATASNATPLRICTGKSEGGYHVAGLVMQETLANAGVDAEIITDTGGSYANVRLATKPTPDCDAFIAQPEAIERLRAENPTEALKLELAGTLFPELSALICRRDEPTSFGKLMPAMRAGKAKLAVPGADSGPALVLWNIGRAAGAIDTLRPPAVVYATNTVQAVQNGDAHCGLIVGVPNAPDFQAALAAQASLHIVPFDPPAVAVSSMTGLPFYRDGGLRPEHLPGLVDTGWMSNTTPTLVASSAVYVRRDVLAPTRAALSQAITLSVRSGALDQITPTWMRNAK